MAVGFVVGRRAGSRRVRVAAHTVGVLAAGTAVAIHLGVDDGQPFVVHTGRYADNDDVTTGPRTWPYLRTLLLDIGLGLLVGAAITWLAMGRCRLGQFHRGLLADGRP